MTRPDVGRAERLSDQARRKPGRDLGKSLCDALSILGRRLRDGV
jgi:hypothetical protein